jgi:hypothetical protein
MTLEGRLSTSQILGGTLEVSEAPKLIIDCEIHLESGCISDSEALHQAYGSGAFTQKPLGYRTKLNTNKHMIFFAFPHTYEKRCKSIDL